ncbi:MAG: type II toxin-antitoxin system RelE/ParE family toxin [Chloroflexi bacterium]|nr:type II toxin-antitoxin system RelE/ParE family toxin [Chloroflexota bacterium]
MEFYESRLRGLGLRFLSAVKSAIERFSAFPESGSPLGGGLRKLILRGFPYSIIYLETGENILLLAVAHHYRRPEYWARRSQPK